MSITRVTATAVAVMALVLAASSQVSVAYGVTSSPATTLDVQGIVSSRLVHEATTSSSALTRALGPSPTLEVGYLLADSTLHLTYRVLDRRGRAMAFAPVVLRTDVADGGHALAHWSLLDGGHGASSSYSLGAMSSVANAQGLVHFVLRDEDPTIERAPTSMFTSAAVTTNEAAVPWSRFVLEVASPDATPAPALDVLVVAPSWPRAGETLTARPTSTSYGSTLTPLSATLNGVVPPGATLSFAVDGTALCQTSATSSLTCSLVDGDLTPGPHALVATVTTPTGSLSSPTTTLTVGAAPTSISLTPSVTSVSQSDLASLTVSAAMTSPAAGPPASDFTFTLDGTVVASSVSSISFASLDATLASVGTHTLVVSFPGSGDFAAASSTLTLTITAPTTGGLPSTTTDYDVAHGPQLWSESFADSAGTAPDASVWTPVTGSGTYGTGEIENNVTSAASEDGQGNLVLTATCASNCESPVFGQSWTSSRLWSRSKVNFQYGQLEADVEIPTGSFNWPAFWMLGADYNNPTPWPNSGEIDIMEGLQQNSIDQSTLHANYPNSSTDWNGGGGVTMRAPLANISAGFHTFGVIWTPTSLSFTLDGYVYGSDVYNASAGTITQDVGGTTSTFDIGGPVWPFDQPFFMILDDAIPAGTTAPNGSRGQLKVAWIRYYKYGPYGTVTP